MDDIVSQCNIIHVCLTCQKFRYEDILAHLRTIIPISYIASQFISILISH